MNNTYLISCIIDAVISAIVVLGGMFVLRGSIGQATSEAQQSAISAMQSELETLRSRTDDLKEENKHQQNIIQTICEALKVKGIIICINGDIVHIKDNSGSSTSARIQECSAS
jgi:hypothetical protein